MIRIAGGIIFPFTLSKDASLVKQEVGSFRNGALPPAKTNATLRAWIYAAVGTYSSCPASRADQRLSWPVHERARLALGHGGLANPLGLFRCFDGGRAMGAARLSVNDRRFSFEHGAARRQSRP